MQQQMRGETSARSATGTLRRPKPARTSKQTVINVDYTHVGRRASGIERITTEQFNKVVLSPLEINTYEAPNSRLATMIAQMVGLPLHAIRNPNDIFIFPGFPPSPYFNLQTDRSVLYVHDLFLLTRPADLNRTAKYYMAPLFSAAIKTFRYFLTNSEDTASKLRAYCDPTATVVPYRPYIRNVFGLTVGDRPERPVNPTKLRIVSIGTIEPRKNFTLAAEIREELSKRLNCEVELHIVGRFGWGEDVTALTSKPNVVLHGYLSDAQARSVIELSDLLLCTSHEEGLCLPLLEAQYSGMPIIAPNDGVFREVLGTSGILLNSRSPKLAADQISEVISDFGWRSRFAAAAIANIDRWNAIAENDRKTVISFLSRLAVQFSSPINFAIESSSGTAASNDSSTGNRSSDGMYRTPLVDIDGQYVNVSGLTEAIDCIIERLADSKSFLVCTLNLDHLVKLRQISSLRKAYSRAAIVTADGFPIVVLSRLRGRQIRRAPGSDLIQPLCTVAAERHIPIFLMGSSFSVLCASARRLVASCPGLEIAGVYAPPSSFDVRTACADEAINLLRQSDARICFLALGAPLQEAFALRALEETSGVGLIGVGAGLDFLAGTKIRAPQIVRRMNLEWAWRLISDPRRLWRRYAECGTLFARLLIGEVGNIRKRRFAGGK
jgi:exopolysaccharide biosynthesis WecB/TagA/CpsF family protein